MKYYPRSTEIQGRRAPSKVLNARHLARLAILERGQVLPTDEVPSLKDPEELQVRHPIVYLPDSKEYLGHKEWQREMKHLSKRLLRLAKRQGFETGPDGLRFLRSRSKRLQEDKERKQYKRRGLNANRINARLARMDAV